MIELRMSLLRILFLLTIFSVWPAMAEMEFLPSDTLDRKKEILQRVAKFLPWATSNKEEMLIQQMALQTALSSLVPNYDQWASEKPGPYVITISKKNVESITAPVLDEAMFVKLLDSLQTRGMLSAIKNAIDAGDEASVFKILGRSISRHLADGADLPQGILIGIANSQLRAVKDAIFLAGGPWHQLLVLRSTVIDQRSLSAKFNPRRAGLTGDSTVLHNLTRTVERSLALQLDLLSDLVLTAALLKKGISAETVKRVQDDLARLNQRLFEFLAQDSKLPLGEVLSHVKSEIPLSESELRRKVNLIRKNLEADYFTTATQETVATQKILTLYEVHPYLAVHRGCIGGDCATTSSWAFPYSPFEHVFYIFENNRPIGYMSATRLKTRNGMTLYVKDIVGPNISPRTVENIVNSLPQLKEHYGAEEVSLAHSSFTVEQNKYKAIKDTLADYDDRKTDFSQGDLLQNAFFDVEIRDAIVQVAKVTYKYDKDSTHSNSIVLRTDPEIVAGLEVKIAPGTLETFVPTSNKEALLTALLQLSVDPETEIEGIEGVNPADVRYLADRLKNPMNFTLENYYQHMDDLFAEYGITLSGQFRNKHQELFWQGHLSSFDTFSKNRSGEISAESTRYLLAVIKRGKDLSWLGNVVHKWGGHLSKNQDYLDLLKSMADRGSDNDFARLAFLRGYDSESVTKLFNLEHFRAHRESLLMDIIDNKAAPFLGNATFYTRANANLHQIGQAISGRLIKRIDQELNRLRKDFNLGPKIDNPRLREWFDRHGIYRSYAIDDDKERNAILEYFIRERHVSMDVFLDFLITNRIWFYNASGFYYKPVMQEMMSERDLFFAYLAMYENGNLDVAQDLARGKHHFIDSFENYLQTNVSPIASEFGDSAPYNFRLNKTFVRLFNAIANYDGIDPREIHSLGISMSELLQRKSIKDFLVRKVLGSNKPYRMLMLAHYTNAYAEFINLLMSTVIEDYQPGDLHSYLDLISSILEDPRDFSYKDELKEKLRLRLLTLRQREVPWANTVIMRFIGRNIFTTNDFEETPATINQCLSIENVEIADEK